MQDVQNNIEQEVEEGVVGNTIRLGALLTMLAVPGVSSADEINSKLPKKDAIEAVDIRAAMNDAAPKKTYSGYTIQQAANIIARTLYDEARSEGTNGVDAVASTILNRAGGKAENLPNICLAKMQFSCWNDKTDLSPDKYEIVVPKSAIKPGKNKDMWLHCQKISGKMIFEEFKSTIGNLNSYHTLKVNPKWDALLKDKKTIGNHVFGYLPEYDGYKTKNDFYKIQKGDTLGKIAQAKNTTVEEILKLNPKIKNPNKISIGMKLKLPS